MHTIRYIAQTHPANNLPTGIRQQLEMAQNNLVNKEFDSAYAFLEKVLSDLALQLTLPSKLKEISTRDFVDRSYTQLLEWSENLLNENDIPKQVQIHHRTAIANRIQLVQAFPEPERTIAFVKEKVIQVVNRFPRETSDVERGKNKGDVLDPYILAATQYLLFGGEFEAAIGATVAHKALMMIEGLMGHLHEEVISMMRGNVRCPEPRGHDPAAFDYQSNPFPGADMVQPPLFPGDRFKFHQIKSKTGSAKGGDGVRLGKQLAFLANHFDSEIFYHALIGNTLVGHRSKSGVEKAAPEVVVLVGNASFKELTHSSNGPALLLRLYQSAFVQAAEETGYEIESVKSKIAREFLHRTETKGGRILG